MCGHRPSLQQEQGLAFVHLASKDKVNSELVLYNLM